MAKITTSSFMILTSALLLGVLATPILGQGELPHGLVYMGSTATKELYITYPNITADFTYSLVTGCPLRFNMKLAAVETPEDVAVIDSHLAENGGNNIPAWTSALDRIGLIPGHWASTGMPVNEYPATILGPWPSGAGSAPAYASYNCVTIQRACAASPEGGCSPATGDFTHSLVMGCKLRFNMKLAAVETPEDIAAIDNYFLESGQNNVPAWTSAVARIGLIPGHWASTGMPINEYPAYISGPWPAGAESAPAYASHNCVTIQRACNSPEGGCSPAMTNFYYRVCTVNHRYICEQPTL